MQKTDFSLFNNEWYKPGAGFFLRTAWYIVNAVFFCSRFPSSTIKVALLRFFGAKLGKAIVIKPGVNIKYPWKLEIGNNCWIGENVWIDNLAKVSIGNNVCISQGVMLLTGNHNYKLKSFDLMTGEIILEEGTWIGARSTVCPGIKCFSHSVLGVGSVATKNLEAYSVYQGVPAFKIRDRVIKESPSR
jgi:putative colanic acid biosynthesis acetyltransferase WcaF